MGKKAREKRERERQIQKITDDNSPEQEPFLVKFIQWCVFGALLTPLIISSKFYFPFVGLKSLYLMGFCQVIFFAWLILILNHKEYRPTLNRVLIALGLFVGVVALSSVLGVDFSRSFWSKFERMTGLLMWLHLFGFFLAISSTFRYTSQWRKIFYVSCGIASLVAIMAILEEAGVKAVNFSAKKGATLGNTSFLGTYLLFNVFLGVWLILSKTRGLQHRLQQGPGLLTTALTKGILGLAVGLMIVAMYMAGARAALGSTIGGLGLLILLWLGFRAPRLWLRIAGRVLLGLTIAGVLASVVLLFVPQSFVAQKFIKMTSYARYANWEMARKAFLDRPILGWGPENYILAFGKYFNPCLFTSRCGGEIWFDRSHNIIFDILVSEGVIGLVAYIGIFAGVFYALYKGYNRTKKKIEDVKKGLDQDEAGLRDAEASRGIGFWSFGVVVVMLSAYFLQNLTVFDMATSLMMFTLILGFVAGITQRNKGEQKPRFIPFNPWAGAGIFAAFVVCFFTFVWQPLKTDALVIDALMTNDPQERIGVYKKALDTSPLGKYQIREFFAQRSQNIIQQVIQKHPKELNPTIIKQELDFVIKQLKKTKQESPLDLKTTLRLANLYNVYARLDPSKIKEAEKYGQEMLQLSPTNQQGYWALAQTRVYQHRFDEALNLAERAVYLEPNWLQSHLIAFQIAKMAGKENQSQAIKALALKLHPEWKEHFK